ncbi:MAG: bis(5'-nucleosyl)-tetraphosphatase (symmetrical) YqeK [Clostridia bacterium]|nr:bis(5'-nucleosyl)-tetraphosphatase (symmetrical) YqeK [Clostridia bacterium]
MTDRRLIISELELVLKKSRVIHTLGVEEMAIRMAGIFGEDRDKASLAALFHDYAKYINDVDMLKLAEHYGIYVDDVYAEAPNLMHGPVGAKLIQEKFGINDSDVLNAITYHTVGRAGMSLLEKIIYVADMTEKNRDFPGVQELREKATENIDEAMILCLEQTIAYTLKRRKKIHINSIQTYNSIIENIRR